MHVYAHSGWTWPTSSYNFDCSCYWFGLTIGFKNPCPTSKNEAPVFCRSFHLPLNGQLRVCHVVVLLAVLLTHVAGGWATPGKIMKDMLVLCDGIILPFLEKNIWDHKPCTFLQEHKQKRRHIENRNRISERSMKPKPTFSPWTSVTTLRKRRDAGTVARKGCKFPNLGFESSSLRDLRAPARPESRPWPWVFPVGVPQNHPRYPKYPSQSLLVKHGETKNADLWIPNFSKPPDDSKLHF